MDIFISTIAWVVIMFCFSFLDKEVKQLRFRIAFTTTVMFIVQYFVFLR